MSRLLSREAETSKRRVREYRTWRCDLSKENAQPYSHGCWSSRFHYFSATSLRVGNVPSTRICYNLILARPMPPPSVGKVSFMRGHFDHRTNCSSTKHNEGLRSLLANRRFFDEAVCAPLSPETQGQTSIPCGKYPAARGARPRRQATGF